MKKDEIKQVLAGIGLAGLIASIGLSTSACQKSSGSCGQDADTEVEGKAACGEGAAADSAKASCGQEADSTAKGSCGQ